MNTKNEGTNRRGLAARLTVALLGALTALLVAGCGGDDGDGATPAVPTAVLETAQAVSASIGRAGGTLTATATDGTQYQLTIPADALPGPTAITMTPVARIDGLPLSGGLVGAVDLQPSGTVFARTAVLTIRSAVSMPAGQQLTGVYIASGGSEVKRAPALGTGTGILVPVTSFSTHGAGYGTLQELQNLALDGTQSREANEAFWTAYRALTTGTDSEEMFDVYLTWFDNYVLPQLQAARDGPSLTVALAEFEWWSSRMYEFAGLVPGQQALWDPWYNANGGLGDEEIQTRARAWAELAAPKLRLAYDDNNALCAAEKSLAALRNALFFARQAFLRIGQDLLEANGIDPESASRNLCARLVIESLTLAEPLQSTVPSDLDASFELLFEGWPEGQAVPVQVSFSGTNATFGKASPANSNVQGQFTLAVGAQTASQRVVVQLSGCLAIDGEVEPWVCAQQTVERNGSTSTELGPGTRWAGTVDYDYVFAESSASGGLGRMGYSMPGTTFLSGSYSNQIRMTLNTTIDTRTFPATGVVTGAYTVSTSGAESKTGQLGPVGTIPACQVRYDGTASHQVQATVTATSVGNVGWGGGTVNLLPPTYTATGTRTDTFQYTLTHLEECIYFGSGQQANQSTSNPVTISNFVAPNIASGLVPDGTTVSGSVTKTWILSEPNAPTGLTNAYGKSGTFTATVTYNLRAVQ